MFKKHTYDWDEVVIGGGFNAIIYTSLHGSKILCADRPYIFPFDPLRLTRPLGLISALPPTLTMVEIYDYLSYSLAWKGSHPLANNIGNILLRPEENSLRVITINNSVININFKKLRIFDPTMVSGIPFEWEEEVLHYRVLDWFKVRSGMKHNYERIYDRGNNFVRTLFFYLSPRIDGNKSFKDVVTESFFKKEELLDPNYSDAVARLKTISMMKAHGIKGTSNGPKQNLPINIELLERVVVPIKMISSQEEGNIIIDSRTEQQVVNDYNTLSRDNSNSGPTA